MKFVNLVAVVHASLMVVVLLAMTIPSAAAANDNGVALLIIDVQDCFLPGGNLAVKDGEQIIPVINKMRKDLGDRFSVVALSQDWHCPKHVSFASQHVGVELYDTVNLAYDTSGNLCFGNTVPYNYTNAINCTGTPKSVEQTMWPDHCIENVTSGGTSASFSRLLTQKPSDVIVRKGVRCWVDSYSAFFDNGGFRQTELDKILKDQNISIVVVTGLALDYCVFYTSKDAYSLGYKVLTVTDACRGVDKKTTDAALQDMRNIGIQLVTAAELPEALKKLTGAAAELRGSWCLLLLLVLAEMVLAFSSLQ